jgi:hypothetical protein
VPLELFRKQDVSCELKVLANSESGPWIAEIPLHCVIEAWKIE